MPDDPNSEPPAAAPQEIELKFEIEPSGLPAVRALPAFAAPGPKPTLLTSTYWDTPDRDLRRAGSTLRVRRDGAKRLQAVKAAEGAGLLGRGEWEGEIVGDRPDLAALAETPLAEVLTPKLAKRLIPLFTTRVRRTRRLLAQGESEIELSLDEGEIIAGDRRLPLLQLELELKRGAPTDLFAAARPLLDEAPLRLSFVTKATAGYGLADPDRKPPRSPLPALSPDQTAGEAMQAVLRSVLGGLSIAVEANLQASSPRAIHQTRVAARRFRAALALAADLGPDPARDAVEDEVRWFAGELGPARDLDVLLSETLAGEEPDPAQAGAAATLDAALRRARSAAYARADEALRSERLRRLLFEATAWAGTTTGAGESASDFAARVLRRRLKRARKRSPALLAGDAHARHRLRIAAKKLRYAAELLGALHPGHDKRRARFLDALKTLQQALGELNDGAMAASVVARALASSRPTSDAVAAALHAGERIGRAADSARSLQVARHAWERLEAIGPFW